MPSRKLRFYVEIRKAARVLSTILGWITTIFVAVVFGYGLTCLFDEIKGKGPSSYFEEGYREGLLEGLRTPSYPLPPDLACEELEIPGEI